MGLFSIFINPSVPHLNWGDCQVPEEHAHPEMGILLEITY